MYLSRDMNLVVDFLGHSFYVCSSVIGAAGFPKWLYKFILLSVVYKSSSSSTSLLTLGIISIILLSFPLYFIRSDGNVGISFGGLDLQFPGD